MKNSKEIASAVFQARDEYIKRRKQMLRKIKLASAVGGTLCALCLTIAGVGYWNSLQQKLPAIGPETDIITDISTNNNSGGDNDDFTPMTTAPVTTGSEGESKPVVTTAVQYDVQTEPVATQITVVTQSSAVTQTPMVTQTTAVTQTSVATRTTAVTQTSTAIQTTSVTESPAVTQTSPATQISPSKQTTTTVTFSAGEIPETFTTTEAISGEIPVTTTTTEAESVKILDINELKSRYGDSLVVTESTAISWPWEYKPIYRQYNTFTLNDIQYYTSGNKIRKFLLEEKIGTVSVMGYDDDKVIQTMECEVYSLLNVTQERFVAVRFGDTYYVCANRMDTPTSTLGELLDQVDLPKLVELKRFSENGDYIDDNHYVLNDDEYIWNVLSECRDAPYIDDNSWIAHKREYLAFGITSETLGAYKLAMYITKDGYLWTNMLNHYQYLFYIGEEASAKIIEYAMENSEDAEYEPYNKTIEGTIVEITDDYMVIDDSILCENPEEGIQFTILLNDILISRYVDYGVVDVGDFVQITFRDEIYSGYIIDSAISADIAYLDEDGYYVLE